MTVEDAIWVAIAIAAFSGAIIVTWMSWRKSS